MSDVFISYSRKDRDFMATLHGALKSRELDIWVDWEDIPPTAEWLTEIYEAIESTDTFVYVISPDALASQTCAAELRHAHVNNKRIVPILRRDVDGLDVPEEIEKINWILFREKDDFDRAITTLESAIDLDLEWVKAHTRLLVRAKEWEAQNKDNSYTLAGTDLSAAQEWLMSAEGHDPKPTPLQMSYITASQQGAVALQRKQLRGFYIVSIIYAILQSLISYFVVFDEISETGLVFLSPVWLLGLVFGVAGLTIGRSSLKRTVLVTIIAGLLLYAFFIVIWPVL